MTMPAARQKGFTLIELVTVIVILGIVATSVTSFIRFGTQSYTDASDRDALVSTARFTLERLNREVRDALPNSIRTIGNNDQCLEFTPIDKSVIYLDIPVAPEAARNSIEVLMLEDALSSTTQNIAIYALNSSDIYSKRPGVIETFSSVDNSFNKQVPSIINFTNGVIFNTESPTQRLFFIDQAVSYCIENGQLKRYQGYSDYGVTGKPNDSGVLMAEFIENFSPTTATVVPFKTLPATLQRNAIALIRLKFVRNSEEIIFSHEIQVPNVP
ncbi:type II secretion system protein [Colwellia sp. Arc7-635]|uniref:PilW family protein n=1 Tax=Colwellia sp. Arc7-635 TaxID=2497879 RepID=UPI000F85608B|nr:type II secretion system protein [Colwellia sp. Arc7-635]AZQ85764.1 type II secretion system protein [Colwellia sp. Arc7-635]